MARITNDSFVPGTVVTASNVNTKFSDAETATATINNNNIRNAGVDVTQLKSSSTDQTFIINSGVGLGTNPVNVGNYLIASAAPVELVRFMNAGSALKTATSNDMLRLYYQVWVSKVTLNTITSSSVMYISTSSGACFVCWLQYADDNTGTSWQPVPNQLDPANITTGTSVPRNRFGILCGSDASPTASSVMTIPLGAFTQFSKEVDGEQVIEDYHLLWDTADAKNYSATRAYHYTPTSDFNYYGFRVVCMGVFGGDIKGPGTGLPPYEGALVMHDSTSPRGLGNPAPRNWPQAADQIVMTFGDSTHPTQLGLIHMRKN